MRDSGERLEEIVLTCNELCFVFAHLTNHQACELAPNISCLFSEISAHFFVFRGYGFIREGQMGSLPFNGRVRVHRTLLLTFLLSQNKNSFNTVDTDTIAKTDIMQTILVLNAGSSSVKVSLICPASPSGNTSDSSSKPIRIVTAHGERLGTEYSSLHISISMAAADFVSNPVATRKALKHSHSLQLTARATVKQNDHDSNRGNTDCDPPIIKTLTIEEPNMSHKAAIQMIIDRTKELKPELIDSVAAVGHRVVHGGEKFSDATVVDKDVLEALEKISHLAPL